MIRMIYFLLFGVFVQVASGQDVGTDICACQPSTYELTLHVGLECDDANVAGPGVSGSACLVESRGAATVTDPLPVVIFEILVLELDQNLQVVGQTTFPGPYFDGDSVTYTSITEHSPEPITATTLPRGIQVLITGLNALQEPLINTWIVLYHNDCGIFPVLTEGQQIGWSVLTNVGDPDQAFCPPAPAIWALPSSSPSLTPSTTPSSSPTITPSLSPTSTPTAAPTIFPSSSPTSTPTATPTVTPSLSPTTKPSLSPTNTLSTSPTRFPTVTPTITPSLSPSNSPSVGPSSASSLSPRGKKGGRGGKRRLYK